MAGLLSPAPGLPRVDGRRSSLPLLNIGVSAALPALLPRAGGVPLAYLRLLVFNADSSLQSSQTQQLTAAALNNYEALAVQLILPQDGYVTAYVGNESNADVFFDDIQVEHRQGLQVQETQYDPTGLELAGITRATPGLKPLNQYRWNGKEFQADLGMNWNHQDWRFFDPQLGRWHVVDPEIENGQESWTPFSFGYDNALRFADANGRNPGDGGGLPNDFVARGFLGVGMSIFNLAAQAVATVTNAPYKYQSRFVENEDTGQAVGTEISKVAREGFVSEAKSAGIDGLVVGLTFAGGGGQGKLFEQAAGKAGIANAAQGSVSLDTNALVAAVQGGEAGQVVKAAAGRQMTVSTTAAKEFLAKGDKAGLKAFMQENSVQMATNGASKSEVQGLQQMAANQGKAGQGRVLKPGDASVVGGAQNNGATLMTRDSKLANFMKSSGFPVIGF